MGLLSRKLEDDDDDDGDNDGGGGGSSSSSSSSNNNNNNNNNLGSFFGRGRQYNTKRVRKIIECCDVVLYCPCIMLIFLKIQPSTLVIIYPPYHLHYKISLIFISMMMA
jgi:hypothetical protein